MCTQSKRVVAIYVDRASGQWIVRDAEGRLWTLPHVNNGWEKREPYDLVDETELESVPSHYRYLLELPR